MRSGYIPRAPPPADPDANRTTAAIGHELDASVTDLILGTVAVGLALRLRGRPGVVRQWAMTLWAAGAAALAGALHHGPLRGAGAADRGSWVAVGLLLVLMLALLLAASVAEVLGPGRRRALALVPPAGLLVYLAAAVAGSAGLAVILVCESLTMAAVLAVWTIGVRRRHPMARTMMVAILSSALAGVAFALPESATAPLGLDPASLSHLAMIPGLALMTLAVERGRLAGRPAPRTRGGAPAFGLDGRRVPSA